MNNEDLKAMFPGQSLEVSLKDDIKHTVYIRPMPVKFFSRIRIAGEEAEQAMGSVSGTAGLVALVPLLIKHCLDIVNDCVDGLDLTSEYLPHEVVPPVVEMWIEQSFGTEDKVRPWMDLLSQLMERVSGEKVNLWQTLTSDSPDQDSPLVK